MGDGPSSFNADLTARGGTVVSIDPIYMFSAAEIRNRINAMYEEVIGQTTLNQHEFVWKNIKTVDELGRVRMDAMEKFLTDYSVGSKRYATGELPDLPFEAGYFDLALSSHFLFLYSEQLSFEFHINSIKELCRVADEVRIFPILELGAKRSRHVAIPLVS